MLAYFPLELVYPMHRIVLEYRNELMMLNHCYYSIVGENPILKGRKTIGSNKKRKISIATDYHVSMYEDHLLVEEF